jgi:hypothetical protein
MSPRTPSQQTLKDSADPTAAGSVKRSLGIPELMLALGVILAVVHFALARDVGHRAAQDLNIGPALVYVFVPVGLALVLVKIRPLARLGIGYFAGLAAMVVIDVVRSLMTA